MALLPPELLLGLRRIRDSEQRSEVPSQGDISDADLDRLRDEGFLSFKGHKKGSGEYFKVYELTLTGRGLREIGDWPSEVDPTGALLEAIKTAIELAGDDTEKTKLQTLRSAVADISKQTIANILSGLPGLLG